MHMMVEKLHPVQLRKIYFSMKITNFLAEKGIFATPVISPAVPKGEALIRTSYMPTHTKEDLTKVLEVFDAAKKKFTIPSNQ